MLFNIDDFLAGWLGGVASIIVSHPFDTLKVRQQTYNSRLFSALRRTLKHEGVTGLYKGIMSPLFTYGPSNSLFFGVYGNCMRYLENREIVDHHISPTDIEAINRVFKAASIAGFCQALMYCPVEYIKIILQANTEGKGQWKQHYVPPYKGTFEAFSGVYKTSGIRGLYRGFFPMVLRDVPTSGIYVLTYEMLRHYSFGDANIGVIWKDIISGGMAGLLSIVVALPIDVVKTNIQTDNPQNPIYSGSVDCFRKLYKQNGYRIFFKGLPIISIRAFPAHAVMFVVYEFTMSFFE